LVEAQQEALS